jgi:nucleolar MIF4G domain-containing protein 1
MTMITQIKTRKDQRKEKRKKRKRHDKRSIEESTSVVSSSKNNNPRVDKSQSESETSSKTKLGDNENQKSLQKEKTRKRKKANIQKDDAENFSTLYDTNHPELAEAIQSDDAEIAELEKRLGLTGGKKGKEKLHKEYSKLEGFGDDFGDFLDDLDDLVNRVRSNDKYSKDGTDVNDMETAENNEAQSLAEKPKKKKKERKIDLENDGISNGNLNPALADAFRRDDEEISALEKKLGLSKRKEKDKLYKEYSKLEGYGDDFGDFLDDLDGMMARIQQPGSDNQSSNFHSDGGSEDGGEDEELLSMKGSSDELDEDDSVLEELERMQREESEGAGNTDEGQEDHDENEHDKEIESEDSSGSSSDGGSDEDDVEPDHDVVDTYQPSKGEDIYGNQIDSESAGDKKPSKYVPPHLRGKQQISVNEISVNDEEENERRRTISRSLNNCLNRLSEDSLISVAQQVAKLYSSNPTPMVHELIWKNAKDVCIATPMLMVGLIPVYTACITGVHIQSGDTVQLGENILENIVVDLLDRLKVSRAETSQSTDDDQKEIENKHICNLMLFLCYFYNYGIVHCSFIYDIIRHLIENFSEADIECLLILLSHCGRSLRSDDPMALKETVLLVQKKKSENNNRASSSRTEYMVSAIMDLKNNKRKREDTVFTERVGKFRKMLGRVKASAAKSGISKSSSEASLRISLNDIIHADTKGRWWKVGASWVGNQYRFSDDSKNENERPHSDALTSSTSNLEDEDEELLKLASKFRMNTDRKRAIFCIIMGGTDIEDTFEKLCRSSMLQNRAERDTVRVLMECCGNEKSYNKFYGHLAARICEYQPQSKFSLQLAYWDIFKQFDSIGARKGANLAKLLFHLVVTHQALRILPVIKTIDLSDDDMDEATLIFLTIVLSSILDHFKDPLQAKAIFAQGASTAKDESSDEDAGEGIRAGLLVFFMETLKSSPKNKKDSRFRKNFKAIVKELDTDGFENMF